MGQDTFLAKQKHLLLSVPKEDQSTKLEAAFLLDAVWYTKFEGVLSRFLRQGN